MSFIGCGDPEPLRVGCQERQSRVALRLVSLWAAHYRVLPDVVRNGDAVETDCFRGSGYVHEVTTEPLRSSNPLEAIELKSEVLRPILPFT